MLVPWLNFISLHISALLFAYLGILSTMPVTLEEKHGNQAWSYCKTLRYASFAFAAIMVANTILWVWFPIPEIAWIISSNPMFGIVVGIIIGLPCFAIMAVAMKDAGTEMSYPVKETTLHGGIYRKIRHPGALGEMPLCVVLALFVNSLFLVLWMTVYVVLFTAINIHYEEEDLVKRFGDEYIEYRKRTPALLPGFRRKNAKD